ncbi:MAG TPA: DUF5674 family protein [Candidatus Desulfaltia sp.]|nr:DUF5674 family protein [Candidatus Desulfaltia sp.]
MIIVSETIHLEELKKMAEERFGNMVKAVIDISKEIMAVDGELHADEEALLLERGSRQENLWGINIYPEMPENEWIEFDSMINLRPSQGNRTRGVDNPEIRQRIVEIVSKRVEK